MFVFEQVFLELEYSALKKTKNVDLVIDCGANVGYSSAYFLTLFPQCQLIAVEPDHDNFEVLTKNLEPYGARARAIQTGIWSHPANLTLSEAVYRDGGEWARQVRECQPNEEALFQSTDIATLLQQSGKERISILKMDIEGAETIVFGSESYKDWIDRVDVMAVELHDDSMFGKASDVFFDACKGRFNFSTHGELTIAVRKS